MYNLISDAVQRPWQINHLLFIVIDRIYKLYEFSKLDQFNLRNFVTRIDKQYYYNYY